MKAFMITLFLSAIFAENCFATNIQSNKVEWALRGTEWYYNLPGYNSISGELKFVKLVSENETTIDKKICKSIGIYLNGVDYIGTEYLYQSSDSIFYYNSYDDSFHLLYNFSAVIGDTVVVHNRKFKGTSAFFPPYNSGDSISGFSYKVIDLDTVFINDIPLKRQKVEPLNYEDWFFYLGNLTTEPTYIIEGIGSLQYFFGLGTFITPETINPILRCFMSVHYDYINESWNLPCDFTSQTLKEEKNELMNCTVLNDINANFVKISANSNITQIQVFDNCGRVYFSRNFFPPINEMQLDDIKKGLSYIMVITESKNHKFKILKL
jgi:hypothetical protein